MPPVVCIPIFWISKFLVFVAWLSDNWVIDEREDGTTKLSITCEVILNFIILNSCVPCAVPAPPKVLLTKNSSEFNADWVKLTIKSALSPGPIFYFDTVLEHVNNPPSFPINLNETLFENAKL